MAVATDFKVGAEVAFDYTTVDGEDRQVGSLQVERTSQSRAGDFLVTGIRDHDENTQRVYRVDRIRNLKVLADA